MCIVQMLVFEKFPILKPALEYFTHSLNALTTIKTVTNLIGTVRFRITYCETILFLQFLKVCQEMFLLSENSLKLGCILKLKLY